MSEGRRTVKTFEKRLKGRVYVLGDNIDTDQIIPACYLNLVPTIPDEYRKLGSHAMAGLPDGLPPFVTPGKDRTEYRIIVAGRNFGCGSSREHAPVALGAAGTVAVAAESFARIFFRNAIATGEVLPIETARPATNLFTTGDDAEIDLAGLCLRNIRTGASVPIRDPGPVIEVIAAGGIFGFARKMGMIRSS